MILAATDLVNNGFQEWADGLDGSRENLRALLVSDKGKSTLGKHISDLTKKWFKEKEPISKLTIAHRYCEKLEQLPADSPHLQQLPVALDGVIRALKLDSKLSKETVTASEEATP